MGGRACGGWSQMWGVPPGRDSLAPNRGTGPALNTLGLACPAAQTPLLQLSLGCGDRSGGWGAPGLEGKSGAGPVWEGGREPGETTCSSSWPRGSPRDQRGSAGRQLPTCLRAPSSTPWPGRQARRAWDQVCALAPGAVPGRGAEATGGSLPPGTVPVTSPSRPWLAPQLPEGALALLAAGPATGKPAAGAPGPGMPPRSQAWLLPALGVPVPAWWLAGSREGRHPTPAPSPPGPISGPGGSASETKLPPPQSPLQPGCRPSWSGAARGLLHLPTTP